MGEMPDLFMAIGLLVSVGVLCYGAFALVVATAYVVTRVIEEVKYALWMRRMRRRR